MSRNAEVAERLEEIADLLDAKDVDFKPRAYRRAAENVRGLGLPIEQLAEEGEDDVGEIEGVGDAIAAKIVEYLETGEIEELESLREEYPVDMGALTSVEGLGPKRVAALYDALGVQNLDDLEAAAEAGEVRSVEGFGEKTEQNALAGIPFARESHQRELLGDAVPAAERVVDYLAGVDGVREIDVAGSIRRWRPTIGDIDVLVASEDSETVVDAFTDYDGEVIEAGTIKASIRLDGGRVDLRVVDPSEWGSALQYFTGSKDHNLRVRNVAIDRGLKMNEYGVFDVSERSSDGQSDADASDDVSDGQDPDAGQRVGERIAGETEESMYDALGLPWIPPELREDRGEVRAAREGTLPDLLEEGEVRGDLHTHSDWSDGAATVAEMIRGAEARGYDYVAVTDHATGPGMVGGVGLDDAELREQLSDVREAADDADVEVFTGVEANVAEDGSVSVADDLLADLDCVVASPHAALDGDGTERLVAAIEHPGVNVVGHPTGRMLNQRPGMELDIDAVAEAAAREGVALEINANPARLDLEGGLVKRAVEAGATVAINTDAHQPESFDFVRYGVHTARRGWCEPSDVLNTRPVEQVRDFLGL